MHKISALGAAILTSKKKISLSAFSPPIVLPLYFTTDERILSAMGVAVSAPAACISAVVQGARLLEPHSASSVKFKVDRKLVPPRDLLLEPSDEHFVPVVVDGYQVVVGGGFALPVANETDNPIELEQTTRFSVSTIGGDDGDMRFETPNTTPLQSFAAGLRFAVADDRRQRCTLRRDGVL